jgi:hypothetical protein
MNFDMEPLDVDKVNCNLFYYWFVSFSSTIFSETSSTI